MEGVTQTLFMVQLGTIVLFPFSTYFGYTTRPSALLSTDTLPSLQSHTCFSVSQTANKLLSVSLRSLPVGTKFEIICMNRQVTSIERFALIFTGK